MIAERRYQMTRIARGDYLLPSNDGKTLWRISAYGEDGSAQYQDERGRWHKVTGTFWQTAKRPMPSPETLVTEDFLDDWNGWTTWDSGLRTRREAIDVAMREP